MSDPEKHTPYESADPDPPENRTQDERNLGMLCHLLALVGLIIPFGNILGPLLVWLLKKDENRFVDVEGKEALNFNITIAIAGLVSGILTAVMIGFALMVVVGLFWLILTIVAAVKASSGEHYRYPLTLRFLQ